MPTNGLRRSGRKAPLIVIAAVALLSTAACGDKTPPKQGRPSVAVLVATTRRASVPYTIEANGVVTPMQSAAVTSQVDGIVLRVNFREGQDVSKGQELFQIDPRPYQGTYDQAHAALARDRATAANAKAQYDRYNELVKSGIVTQEQAEQLRAAAQSSQATVEADLAIVANAKFNLDNTVIRAPITGRSGSILVLPGNVVRAGGTTPLVVIHQIHPILVRFAVPATELRGVLRYGAKGGLPVTAAPSGSSPAPDSVATARRPAADSTQRSQVPAVTKPGAGDISRGTLSFIDNAVDTTTGTVLLKASFPNSDGLLWVGQFVAASLRLYVEDNALVVPTQSVISGQKGTYVYVVDSTNSARQRPVVVERTAGNISVIASGLDDGEKIVTEGQSRLTPGAPVEIRVPGDSAGGKGKGKGARGARGGKAPAP